MKPGTQNEVEGAIHEVKGKIKETIGRVTNTRRSRSLLLLRPSCSPRLFMLPR